MYIAHGELLLSPTDCHRLLSTFALTFILLEPKAISLCHQYRAKPAFTSVQSGQALYCWLPNFKFSF